VKKFAVMFLVLVVAGASLVSAQEAGAPRKSFTIDAGAALAFGLFDSMPSSFGDLSGIATIASLRGGFDGALFYRINDFIEAGPMIGLYYLSTSTSTSNYTFFDFPLRAAAKIGKGATFIEPYAGYYATSAGFPFPGLEFGARAALGGFFVEGSYVLGAPNWKHIALGYTISDIFGF
jgi:hypothetical protein